MAQDSIFKSIYIILHAFKKSFFFKKFFQIFSKVIRSSYYEDKIEDKQLVFTKSSDESDTFLLNLFFFVVVLNT